MMILCKPRSAGSVGRDELAKWIEDFEGGRWVELLEAAVVFIPGVRHRTQCTEEEDLIRRGPPKAVSKEGKFLEHAMNLLVHHWPPRTRKPLPSCDASVHRNSSESCQAQSPERPLDLDRKIFHDCLHGSPSVVAFRSRSFVKGQVLNVVCRSLKLATMTALQKNDGGVRSIATRNCLPPSRGKSSRTTLQ